MKVSDQEAFLLSGIISKELREKEKLYNQLGLLFLGGYHDNSWVLKDIQALEYLLEKTIKRREKE